MFTIMHIVAKVGQNPHTPRADKAQLEPNYQEYILAYNYQGSTLMVVHRGLSLHHCMCDLEFYIQASRPKGVKMENPP